MNRGYFKLLAAVAGILILVALVLYADPIKFLDIVSKSDKYLVLAAFAISNVNLLVRVMKWKLLLGDVPVKDVAPVQMLGITISNFSPGKVGEPVKAVLMKLYKGLSVSTTLHSVIWERILDVVVLLVLSLVGVYLFSSYSGSLFLLSVAGMSVFLLVIIFALLFVYNRVFRAKIFGLLVRLPVLKRLSENFIETFEKSKIPRSRMLAALAVTALAWLVDGVIFYTAFYSIGVRVDFLFITTLLALATVVGVVTALPGGIGSTEIVMTLFLGLAGVESSAAIAGVLLSRFLTIWYLNLVGGVSLIYLAKKCNLSFRSIFG